MHGGKPIAYAFCRMHNDIITYALLGYDPAFSNWSPGTILLLLVIERLFTQGIFRVFDFGGMAAEYKSFFATGSVDYLKVVWLPKKHQKSDPDNNALCSPDGMARSGLGKRGESVLRSQRHRPACPLFSDTRGAPAVRPPMTILPETGVIAATAHGTPSFRILHGPPDDGVEAYISAAW